MGIEAPARAHQQVESSAQGTRHEMESTPQEEVGRAEAEASQAQGGEGQAHREVGRAKVETLHETSRTLKEVAGPTQEAERSHNQPGVLASALAGTWDFARRH